MLSTLPQRKTDLQDSGKQIISKAGAEKTSLSNFLAKGLGPNSWLIMVMDERTSLNAASITPDYKYAKYLYSVHNNKPYCREMLRQFHKGCASTNGKKMGELSAFTTEVPCMYASREDKERKWRRLIMIKKTLNTSTGVTPAGKNELRL